MSQKFEKLIELIINEDEAKARELFHQIVVEKSKEIYESLEEAELDEADEKKADEELDESAEEMEESLGGDPQEQMMDEIAADEQAGVAEDDMKPEMDGDDDLGEPDMHGDDELAGDDEGMGDEDLEDRVVDLEDALDDLKAEFAKLMDEEPGDDEDFGDEEGMDDEEGDEMPDNLVREYVEKVKAPGNSEEGSVNKKSTVAGKNDMGGSTANIAKGSAEEKGGKAPGAKPLIGKVQNTAGGSKDLESAPKPKTHGEDGGTNKKSPLAK